MIVLLIFQHQTCVLARDVLLRHRITNTLECLFLWGYSGLAERMKMFHWSREDLSKADAKVPEKYSKRGDRGNGGWTTKRSYDGLVRRLLHAMMTQDTFTVVSKYHFDCTGSAPRRLVMECWNHLNVFKFLPFVFGAQTDEVGGHSAAQGQG